MPSTSQPLSYNNAIRLAMKYAQDAITDTPPKGARLVEDQDSGDFEIVSYCSDSDGPAPKGTPVNIELGYTVRGIPSAQVTKYMDDFEVTLNGKGWRKLYGSSKENATAMGKDDFTLLLQFAPSNGRLSLVSNTPCVPPKNPDHPLMP